MNRTFWVVPLLATISGASEKYTLLGTVRDITCPAHVVLEESARWNPAFRISPDKAVKLSGVRCPSKIVVQVYVDSENYYVTTFGEPGIGYTRIVNGKTAKVTLPEHTAAQR